MSKRLGGGGEGGGGESHARKPCQKLIAAIVGGMHHAVYIMSVGDILGKHQ